MSTFAILCAGFSIGTAFVLTLAFSTAYKSLMLPIQSRVAGYVMLVGLSITQFAHAKLLLNDNSELVTRTYAIVVMLQSGGFYWLLLGLLRPSEHEWSKWDWLVVPLGCLAAILAPLWLSTAVTMVLAVLFTIHLGRLLFQLKGQRRWFLLEFRTLSLCSVSGIAILIASLAAPMMGWQIFALIYSVLIAGGFGLVAYLLLRFPDITVRAQEAVASSYAASTLNNVDQYKLVDEVKRLFEIEKIYTDEDLSLNRLAELTGLSPHQMSELVNTRFDRSFSALVRYYRVEAAKKMLIDEPRASVLSIGMSVGFSSQSNFYVAFKELTGQVPGQFRKRMLDRNQTTPPD